MWFMSSASPKGRYLSTGSPTHLQVAYLFPVLLTCLPSLLMKESLEASGISCVDIGGGGGGIEFCFVFPLIQNR